MQVKAQAEGSTAANTRGSRRGNKKLLLGGIAAGLLGAAVLAGVILGESLLFRSAMGGNLLVVTGRGRPG